MSANFDDALRRAQAAQRADASDQEQLRAKLLPIARGLYAELRSAGAGAFNALVNGGVEPVHAELCFGDGGKYSPGRAVYLCRHYDGDYRLTHWILEQGDVVASHAGIQQKVGRLSRSGKMKDVRRGGLRAVTMNEATEVSVNSNRTYVSYRPFEAAATSVRIVHDVDSGQTKVEGLRQPIEEVSSVTDMLVALTMSALSRLRSS